MTEQSIKADLHIVAMDHSEFYEEEIVKVAGKVFQFYMFDKNRAVHCCEIMPSYELFPLDVQSLNTPEDEEEIGELYDKLHDNRETDVIYVHCSVIDKMQTVHVEPEDEDEYTEETYLQFMDDNISNRQANGYPMIPGVA